MSSSAPVIHRGGPVAVGGDLRRVASLTWMLAVTDFKLRYFGSVLGYLWTFMRPLMLFGVMYFVFTQVVRIGADIKHYPVYLLTSIVLFTYFSETTSSGVQSLVSRENLLRKMHFPRIVIPISVSLSSLFNLALNLVVVLIFALASGVQPRMSWLQFPLLVLILVVFSVGLAMLLSVLYVRYRDFKPIWEVATQVLYWGSPILYTLEIAPEWIRREMLAANPLADIFTQMRHAVLDPEAPSVAHMIGNDARILIPLGIVAATFGLGAWIFAREAPRIAENL
jgi:ABC-2 type transport system permease protein